MALLPDPAASRAVLIGCSDFQDLEDLPAVRRNLDGLREVFTDAALWGLPVGNCRLVTDPANAATVLDAVRELMLQATDTLVVYVAGHGLVDPLTDELYLALPDTDPSRLYTALRYEDLRRTILHQEGSVRRTVVILDCCYSGRALGGRMGVDQALADSAMIAGTYLITATGENVRAAAPPGETFTSFTGELIATLDDGIADGPDLIDMDTLYRHL